MEDYTVKGVFREDAHAWHKYSGRLRLYQDGRAIGVATVDGNRPYKTGFVGMNSQDGKRLSFWDFSPAQEVRVHVLELKSPGVYEGKWGGVYEAQKSLKGLPELTALFGRQGSSLEDDLAILALISRSRIHRLLPEYFQNALFNNSNHVSTLNLS